MGGLRKYMPITWITSLLGSLALIGTPLFSGFYSKDSIIEAVHFSNLPASGLAHFALLAGVFVTAFYSFRMYFLVFHGKERFDQNPDAHHDAHHAHLIDLRLPQCVSNGLHALKLQRTLWHLKHLLLRPKKTQVGVDQTRAAPQHQHHASHPRQSTVPTHGLGLPAGRSRRHVGNRGHFMLQVKPTI